MTISRGAAEAWINMNAKEQTSLLRSMTEPERWETLGMLVEALASDEEREIVEEAAEDVFPLAA